ncbi:serine hydrolase domain-containing protein [Mycobacterium lepromatosis]|uniref:serine hydrolase n=2 Tax=Mycobacterium lepromatosis TaxID=480418 RepID=UPI0006961D11
MQRDTLFCIASMTKPVTVAAVMCLVGESKLILHDPIARREPKLAEPQVLDQPDGPLDRTHPAQRAALLEDLFTHTSVLAYRFSVPAPVLLISIPATAVLSELRPLANRLPLVHQPGNRVTYSHSIDALGVIASRIEGTPPFY